MAGPRSDPPIPMFTTAVNACPELLFRLPSITDWLNVRICSRTLYTSGTTFSPSTRMSAAAFALSAVCNTARPSVWLMVSPPKYAARASSRPTSFAKDTSDSLISLSRWFLE